MRYFSFNTLSIKSLCLVALCAISACSRKRGKHSATGSSTGQISLVTADPNWDKLLTRNSGWFGGDGIFAIPMDGAEFRPATAKTKTMFLFSDSVVADTVGETIARKDFSMVHNCIAYLDGSEPDPRNSNFLSTRIRTANRLPSLCRTLKTASRRNITGLATASLMWKWTARSTFLPTRSSTPLSRGAFFEFEQKGVNIIAIPKGSKPPFKDQRQISTPFFFPMENWNKATMGSGVMVNTSWAGAPNPDGYLYILGAGGTNVGLVMARVKPKEFEQFDKWEFAKGAEWTTDYTKAVPVTRFASNEMSLSPMADGRFILAHQYFGMDNEVAVQIANKPQGPYFPVKKVWHCKEWERPGLLRLQC